MSHLEPEKLEKIKNALERIKFGSVLLTIHDGQLTQIDATEKVRFPQKKSSQTKK
ncbi:YezD family protein [Alkalihalobacillus oceani]|uniref:YezD family protein n=1 Tax=Halalkalibacter oceani TaxID=1653776 RepID=UPI00203AB8C4|nr:YezD family protein [Halalkalibacter oceani]MCM3760176.1 YezD family protein [Halalkalibacter oceani]